MDVVEKVRTLTGQWVGHVNKMKDSRQAPREGRRKGRRPRRRWRDESKGLCGTRWARAVQNRQAWRQMLRPYASSGMTGLI